MRRVRIAKVPVTTRGHRVYGGESFRGRGDLSRGGETYLATIPQGSLDLGIEVRASSREEAKQLVRRQAWIEHGYADLRFVN